MTKKKSDYHVLAILMRSDIASMNPGKAAAHAAHAANAFDGLVESMGMRNDATINKWRQSTTQHFGTTLCYAADELKLFKSIYRADEAGFISGVIHDPTFPDYDVFDDTLTKEQRIIVPMDTCGFIFAEKSWIDKLGLDLFK